MTSANCAGISGDSDVFAQEWLGSCELTTKNAWKRKFKELN
jgi:hypothetical protein